MEYATVMNNVIEFHKTFDLTRQTRPNANISQPLIELRIHLLEEELAELTDAARAKDIVAIADALADIVYVAYGSAITYGINLDSVLDEVHKSNMSKLDSNGQPILRYDGKVCKSQLYRPPNIAPVLTQQPPLPV